MNRFWPLCCLLLVVGCVTRESASGIVLDERQQPIEGALVSFLYGGKVLDTVKTGKDGTFNHTASATYTCSVENCSGEVWGIRVMRSAEPEAAHSALGRGPVILYDAPVVSVGPNGIELADTTNNYLVDDWLPWRGSDGPLPVALLMPAASHSIQKVNWGPSHASLPLYLYEPDSTYSFSARTDLPVADGGQGLPLDEKLFQLSDGDFESGATCDGAPLFPITFAGGPRTIHSVSAVGVTDQLGQLGVLSVRVRTGTEDVELPPSSCTRGPNWISCEATIADVLAVLVFLSPGDPAPREPLQGMVIAEAVVR